MSLFLPICDVSKYQTYLHLSYVLCYIVALYTNQVMVLVVIANFIETYLTYNLLFRIIIILYNVHSVFKILLLTLIGFQE